MTQLNTLNIVVANALEANPLVELLELEHDPNSMAYKTYENERGISLIVSGMGKAAAASATAHLAASQATANKSPAAWLNLGIAGHQTVEIGTGLLAHKITERASGASYYPPLLLDGFDTSDIITVDEPELHYPDAAAYEMEAFGFYRAATRIITSELVQVYKIVSDNPSNPSSGIDLNLVSGWIIGQAEQILKLTTAMIELATEYNDIYRMPVEFDELRNKAKLSATQVSQLRRLCQRYHALGYVAQLRSIAEQSYSSAKQLIGDLESGLANLG